MVPINIRGLYAVRSRLGEHQVICYLDHREDDSLKLVYALDRRGQPQSVPPTEAERIERYAQQHMLCARSTARAWSAL